MMALVALMCMAACSTELDKQCDAMAPDIQAQNWDAVATKADAIYQKKAECSAKNLASLAIAYQVLAATNQTDAVKQLTYVQRIVECYEAGVAKDASVVEANMKAANMANMADMVSQYKANMAQYESEAAIQENGGAATEEAEGEEGEEEAAEEGEEETEEEETEE